MKHAFILILIVAFGQAGIIHPQLADILETTPDNEPIEVIVHMAKRADWSTLPATTTKAEKILYLQNLAETDQADVLAYLESLGDRVTNITTWWVFNGFMFKGTRDVIEAVAARADVDYVIDNFTVYIHAPEGEEVSPDAPTWNITQVSAHLCWNDGYDGAGVIVGNMDTGVDVSHPAFGGRWVPGGWYDAINGQPNPYDDHGHGTHTMGTTCGGDGNGPFDPDIGVAPGANFIAAKCFNSSGGGSTAGIHACFQWYTTQSATVVGNSWGSSATTSLEYWDDCVTWRNLGIYPVFSNGNSGPGSGTAGTPGNFPTVTGVGAVDSGDNIASFSSRGPAPNQSPWTDTQYWERPDWNRTKPDISAPGVSVYSAAPGGSYQTMDGTSMACPHVTGAVALLQQKNPAADYNVIYNILLDYADEPSQGAPYPNNDYGWGRLNCYASLSALPVGDAPNLILTRVTVVNDNNGNGKLDPGETAGIVCYVRNNGTQAANNINGTLRTASSWITITDSTYFYGSLAPDDSANNTSDPFDLSVHASTPPGTIVNFTLELAATESTWVRSFSLTVGVAPGEIIWGPKSTTVPSTGFIYGVTYDFSGDQIFVLDAYSRLIRRYSSDSFVTSLGQIAAPDTLCSDISYCPYDDQLYVTSWNQKRIWKINKSTGAVLRSFLSPANDYPVGIAYHDNTIWCADRRVSMGATQWIYISDTLGSATQYTNPVQGYYNSRCLCFDSLGQTYSEVHTYFNSSSGLDSVGVVEMQGVPPAVTGNRFLLNPGWNIRGIEADPRDGNFWITIAQISGTYVNQVVKVKGFHEPPIGVGEGESELVRDVQFKTFPNPTGSHLTLSFTIPVRQQVAVKVYDAAGRLVNKIMDVPISGSHEVTWNLVDADGQSIASGIYFVVIETPTCRHAQKIIVTR